MANGLLIGGLALALGTGLVHLWDDARHDRWTDEDNKLRAGPGASDLADSWRRRQDENDRLLRSIWRTDTAVGIMAGLAAVCVVGSATLGLLPEPGIQVTATPTAVHLAYRLVWP